MFYLHYYSYNTFWNSNTGDCNLEEEPDMKQEYQYSESRKVKHVYLDPCRRSTAFGILVLQATCTHRMRHSCEP